MLCIKNTSTDRLQNGSRQRCSSSHTHRRNHKKQPSCAHVVPGILLVAAILMVPAYSANVQAECLFGNGQPSSFVGTTVNYRNGVDFSSALSYDDFDVPFCERWTITSISKFHHFTGDPIDPEIDVEWGYYEFRRNITPGDGGVLLASGVVPVSVTPLGTAFEISASIPVVILDTGKYWATLAVQFGSQTCCTEGATGFRAGSMSPINGSTGPFEACGGPFDNGNAFLNAQSTFNNFVWVPRDEDYAFSVDGSRQLLPPPPPPTITQQPMDEEVCIDDPATFCVTATGIDPLLYQWLKDGVEIAGGTSSCLDLMAASASDVGSYSCVVTNECSSVESASTTLQLGVDCPQACCAGGACIFLSADDCLTFGGTPDGLGTTCSTSNCSLNGACCRPEGTCIDSVSGDTCTAFSASYQGDETSCAGITCFEPVGACCNPMGGCLDLTFQNCPTSFDWAGPMTSCSDIPDPCLMPMVADFDFDGDTDIGDHAFMSFCIAGPSVLRPDHCRLADLDDSFTVDLGDYALLQQEITAP